MNIIAINNFNKQPNKNFNVQNSNASTNYPITKSFDIFQSETSFKANKNKNIEDINIQLLDIIKKNKSLQANIKTIVDNPEKQKTFFKLLGTLLASTAASLTNLIVGETAVDNISFEVPVDKKTNNKTSKTKKSEDKTNQEIRLLNPRGRRTTIEANLVSFIDKPDLKQSDKNLIIDLYNNLCGFNKSGSQNVDGTTIKNTYISQMLFNRLNDCNIETDIPQIYDKFKNNKFSEEEISELLNDNEEIVREREVLQETFSKYNNIKKQYKTLTEGENGEKNSVMLKKLFVNIANNDKEISNRIFSKLNQKYSDILIDIATINSKIEQKDRQEFYINISNHNISKNSVLEWLEKYSKLSYSFNKFNDLYNANVETDASFKGISEMIKDRKIIDFNIKNINGKIEIELVLPKNKSLIENFKTVVQFYKAVEEQDITLTGEKDEYINANTIIKELKKDFNLKNSDKEYRNLINYLYGFNHIIFNTSDYDKHIKENKMNEIIKLVNDDKIFNRYLFDTHSKLRFIERFILNETLRKRIDYVAKDKLKYLENDINEELAKGVTISEYNKYGLNAPQLEINTQVLGNISITLDDSTKIHTIFSH